MPTYIQRGKIPAKRHIQFRDDDGNLYYEELVSRHGFSSIYSNLYHTQMPTKTSSVGMFTPHDVTIIKNEHRHRHLRTARVDSSGDAVSSRRLLLFNNDVRISKSHFTENMTYHYRNGHADEVLYIQQGEGQLSTNYGLLHYSVGDYLIIPRGVIWQLEPAGPTRMLVIETTGIVETPEHYRNSHGQLLEEAPFCERDFRLPEFASPIEKEGDYPVHVNLAEGSQVYHYAHHPFDVVGWDGTFYPWAFNILDFEPLTGRIHQPPPIHQTFQAPGLVICSFVPRLFDYHPEAIPAPYYHSNVDSDEVLFYSRGDFMSRTGIEEESITLHPMGLPHGPQPGKYEGSIGLTSTDELAVMIDTFAPLKITQATAAIDDPGYPASWQS